MSANWVLLTCIGKSVLYHGGKGLLNYWGGQGLGDAVFAEVKQAARSAYDCIRKGKDGAGQVAEVQAMAQASVKEAQQHAEKVAQEVAADQPPEIRAALKAYLAQVPSAIRRSLRRPSDPTGTTVPPGLALRKAEDLLRFLPARMPRFRPGDQPLPGVDLVLEELLGVGGFGEVWKARNPYRPGAPPVALKFCLDESAAKALRNEVALLDRVQQQGKHKGIVQLLDTYLNAATPFLKYEFVEGGDLAGVAREWHRSETPPTPRQAAKVILRLAEIVGFTHRLVPPICHRDLKPANVLVQRTADGATRFKVADFGIGGVAAGRAMREATGDSGQGSALVSSLQGSYTPLYASPQQMRGQPPDPRDDVYSLGVIWWQLLTGDLASGPPTGLDWPDDLKQRGMSDPQIRLLASCFSDRAERRPADARTLADQLTPFVKEEAAPSSLNDPPPVRQGEIHQGGPRRIEATVPGVWYARPADKPEAGWSEAARTPGTLALAPGEVYRFKGSAFVTDEQLAGLADLRPLTGLQQLDLESCRRVTDAGLAHLRQLTALQELTLNRCSQVTDAGLAHLGRLTGLRQLSLWRCEQVTDAGLAYLGWLTGLRQLVLSKCERITDAGLAHLGRLAGLQQLMLASCTRVTDGGLAHLARLTELQQLDLAGCDRVTENGLAVLRQALPRCRITH